MGMSIFLLAEKRLRSTWSNQQIHLYFLKRGGIILLFMVLLELPAWGLSMITTIQTTDIGVAAMAGLLPEGIFPIPTSVLYGLGACMMIAGFLWRLKAWQLLSITLASFWLSWWYISSSNPAEMHTAIEHLLIIPGRSPFAMVLYPVIPWLGITTFGIFWAQMLRKMPEQIYKLSLITGLIFIALFIVLRLLEMGNFSIANNDSWVNFFTLVKYPPSSAFALITCGINLLLLCLFSTLASSNWLQPVRIFGQTAMFFYIIRLYLFALISAVFPIGCTY